jgi:hypothetical protein
MKRSPILSVVFQKAQLDLSHFDYEKNEWIEKGPPLPVNQYIGSGGHMTDDLQKAQVFGFSKKAKERLKAYKDPRLFEIKPVIIKEINHRNKRKNTVSPSYWESTDFTDRSNAK